MSLESKLAEIREMASQRIPEASLNVMHAAVAALRDAGIVKKAIQVGDKLPEFALANQDGKTVKSSDLLAKGAVVLTVFRGHW